MPQKRVVIVEDDAAMRRALCRLLGAAGFDVRSFPSAEAFLDDGGATDSVCLVLDIHLPGLSGFALHRRLTGSGASVRAIFITAHDDDTTRAEAASLGAEAYFTKPIRGRQLMDAIESALLPA